MGRREKPKSFTDLLTVDFRWPRHGDRLFVASDDPATDAQFIGSAHSRKVFMADGYKNAADVMVDEALGDEFSRHGLVYPIIFCYRQYIELSLKRLLDQYGREVGIPPSPHGHDLKKLLRRFRAMLRAFDVGEPNGADIAVSKCILEFDRLDPNSFTFRYATAKDGKPYPIAVDRVDLVRLRDVMDGMHGFFDGTDGYLSALVSA